MSNSNRVTLSDDTIKQLEKVGKPFESVDDCLKRVLSCDCVQKEMKKDVVEGESQ